jgi:hypothetical protein
VNYLITVISAISTLLPATNADNVVAIARVGADICGDVYNSDRAWYQANTNPLDASQDFSFVEGRGTAAQALFDQRKCYNLYWHHSNTTKI